MTVTWWTASCIILHQWSIAYELSIYCASLIYFSVVIAIITTKYQKHYFCYHYLFLPLPLLSYYFATKYFAADIKFPGVVELTTQLLILEIILWLPLCWINKFGLNTLPLKAFAIPYTCGLSLANRDTISPIGILRDAKVLCGKVKYPIDFLVLDSPQDDFFPIIFGRPFLNTVNAKIDCEKQTVGVSLVMSLMSLIFPSLVQNLIKRIA